MRVGDGGAGAGRVALEFTRLIFFCSHNNPSIELFIIPLQKPFAYSEEFMNFNSVHIDNPV